MNLELDIHVVRDIDFQYDLLIGRNSVQYPDIEIITDSTCCRLVRKPIENKAEANLIDLFGNRII